MMVEYLKIPAGRIKLFLQDNNKLKKLIEKQTKTKISLNAELNEVTIESTDAEDPLAEWKCRDIIKAIGRGFDPEIAFNLLEENTELRIINLKEQIRKSKKSVIRIKGRVIGLEGKAKKRIEDITDTSVCVHGNTVSVIGDIKNVEIACRAISMLIGGSMHGTVWRMLEESYKNG